jgi:D-3-phosphoglycerate dehydrogenase
MRNQTPVAVTSRSFSRNKTLRDELQSRYENVKFNDEGLNLSGRALVEFLKGFPKAIIALEVLDKEIIEQLPDLKILGKYGVGLDKIDLEALDRKNILLGWKPGVNCRSVAELALSFMIALFHQTPAATSEVLAGTWRQHIGKQLSRKTVGLIGCGHVGQDVVRLLKPFDCNILVHDKRTYDKFYSDHAIKPVALDELMRTADVVSVHIPLTRETRGMISSELLSNMDPHSYLVNTARGCIVDEQAVKKMLQNNLLAGAAFDVFAEEPPTDQELLHLPNFLVTPHIGGSSEEAILAMGRAAIAGLDNPKAATEFSEYA